MLYMLHFYSHKADYPYWMNTSIDFWEKEAGRQREILTTYSNVPVDQIQVTYLFN